MYVKAVGRGSPATTGGGPNTDEGRFNNVERVKNVFRMRPRRKNLNDGASYPIIKFMRSAPLQSYIALCVCV